MIGSRLKMSHASASQKHASDALLAYVKATETEFIARGLNNRLVIVEDAGGREASTVEVLFESLRLEAVQPTCDLLLINSRLACLHALLLLLAGINPLHTKYEALESLLKQSELALQRVGCASETPASLYTSYSKDAMRGDTGETNELFFKRITRMQRGSDLSLNLQVLLDAFHMTSLNERLIYFGSRISELLKRSKASPDAAVFDSK